MTRPLTATQYDALTWLAKSGRNTAPPFERSVLNGLYVKRLVSRVPKADALKNAPMYSWFITAEGVTALREYERALKVTA